MGIVARLRHCCNRRLLHCAQFAAHAPATPKANNKVPKKHDSIDNEICEKIPKNCKSLSSLALGTESMSGKYGHQWHQSRIMSSQS
eukprot:605446-Amphidinium_carterae.1